LRRGELEELAGVVAEIVEGGRRCAPLAAAILRVPRDSTPPFLRVPQHSTPPFLRVVRVERVWG